MFLVLSQRHSLKYILVLLLYNLNEIGTYYYGNKHTRMKKKILKMDKELVMESIRNVKRIDHFKETYQEMAGYEVGDNFYNIRKRYGRMVNLFLTSYNNYDKYPHETLMLHLDEMNHLSIEISHLVEMIQDFEGVSNYAEIAHNKRMKRLNLTTIDLNSTTPAGPGGESEPLQVGRNRAAGSRWKSGATTRTVGRDFLNNDGGAFDSDYAL